MENAFALSLVLAFIYSCRGYPWPADCEEAGERFGERPCHLLSVPSSIDYAGTTDTGEILINHVDCTVTHLRFNWTAVPPSQHYRCFQPLYRCTWNSTNLEPLDVPSIETVHSDRRNRTVESTSVELVVGSECTFGGCYVDFFSGMYKVYWIEPVTCTINDNGCVKNPNACDINADCSDTIGSFECTCRSGYIGNGTYCQDVDECSAGLHNCSDYANCYNTEGGFVCQCQTGFTGDGINCTNVDECHTNPCDSNADCTDTMGSFECTCQSGYTGNGMYCQDVDECSARLHNCSDYANCSNTEGGFVCQCQTGFTGDGINCTNVDECRTNPCDSNAACTDIIGSFECTCKSGYTGNGTYCQDIDECLEGLHGCHQNSECIDTEGGYRCSCETGFVGDGYSCEIGPLIGVLGIGVPALLFLVVCAVAMATCGMVVRYRQKAAALQYMEYFFPWKEPLKPDFEPVDADRRISFTFSIESVFDSLIKPDKTPESAHSSGDGNTTDISFEDTQLLPAHKDRDLASDGKVETAIGHQLAAQDVSKTRAVVEDGLIKRSSVQMRPSYASYSSSSNHSGYIDESSVTTPSASSKCVSTQQQGGYGEDYEPTRISELVSRHQCDSTPGRSGYVGGLMGDREIGLEIPDADQGGIIPSDVDDHGSAEVGYCIHDGRSLTSGLDQSTNQFPGQPVRTDYVDESSFIPLQCTTNHHLDGGYIQNPPMTDCHTTDISQCLPQPPAVLASPVLQTQSHSVPPAYISDSSQQVHTAHSELNHVQDGANRDAVTSASGYTQSADNIVRPETGGYVSYQQSTDSGYVHSSISTEYWAERMGESLSIPLEAEDEEVFASDTVLPKVDGYIQDSMGPPQPSITPHSPIQPVKTDYVTVDESSFVPLQCTTNHHLDSGYIQNPPMTDCHTTDISQCLPQPPMDSGYHSNLDCPTGLHTDDGGTTSGYISA